jgi:hypothetical protein
VVQSAPVIASFLTLRTQRKPNGNPGLDASGQESHESPVIPGLRKGVLVPLSPPLALEDISWNVDLPLGTGPDALEQAARRKGDLELAAVQIGVRLTPQQHAPGKVSVSPGSPCFLIVRLRRWRWGPVDHKPHVRLVDA